MQETPSAALQTLEAPDFSTRMAGLRLEKGGMELLDEKTGQEGGMELLLRGKGGVQYRGAWCEGQSVGGTCEKFGEGSVQVTGEVGPTW